MTRDYLEGWSEIWIEIQINGVMAASPVSLKKSWWMLFMLLISSIWIEVILGSKLVFNLRNYFFLLFFFFMLLLSLIQRHRIIFGNLTEYVKGLNGLFGSSRVMHNHICWKHVNPITTPQCKFLLLFCGWKYSDLVDEKSEGWGEDNVSSQDALPDMNS